MKKKIRSHEFYLLLIFILFSLFVGLLNPAFFSFGNLFKILKSSVEMGLLAICFMLVLILGGIDMSFPAIAVASMYMTVSFLNALGLDLPLIVPFLIAGGIGAVFGSINGILIGILELPTLIITLGTMSLIHGGLVVFVGKSWISTLPKALVEFSKANIIQWTSSGGEIQGLHASVLILVGIAILVGIILKYTWFGRSVFAIGGNLEVAKRHGIPVAKIRFLVFVFVGALGGIAGLLHGTLVRMANPFDIIGTELNVIAAVVLGGVSLSGGSGTIQGTILGVLLINIVNNSLILIGMPSYWQKFFIGAIVILSTLFTANRGKMVRVNIFRKGIKEI
jgi:simple sugar transport system permease protein